MDRDWVLTIGIDKFFLTFEEKEHYLKSVERGAKFVQVRDKVLGVSFQSLAPKQELEGKYKCDSGNWHTKGAECYCDGEWITLEDGTSKFVENKLVQSQEDKI